MDSSSVWERDGFLCSKKPRSVAGSWVVVMVESMAVLSRGSFGTRTGFFRPGYATQGGNRPVYRRVADAQLTETDPTRPTPVRTCWQHCRQPQTGHAKEPTLSE